MNDSLEEYLKRQLDQVLKFKSIKKAYTAVLGDRKDTKVKSLLMDLKMRFGFYHAKKAKSEYEAGFNEGQRSVILHILAMSVRSTDEDIEDIENMMRIINNEA